LLALLTGAIVAAVAPPVGRETELLLFVVAICCCCFLGAAILATAVGFVVVVVCCGGRGDDGDDDDTADVGGGGGVADDDTKGGFTVFGIPHIRASVVLTTLRLGLLGSHIFDLSSADIVGVLSELLLPAAGGDDNGSCCANTWVLLQIPKSNMPTRIKNNAKIELVLLIYTIETQFYYLYELTIN
jgi:hypothetical protein